MLLSVSLLTQDASKLENEQLRDGKRRGVLGPFWRIRTSVLWLDSITPLSKVKQRPVNAMNSSVTHALGTVPRASLCAVSLAMATLSGSVRAG